jgi:dTDP-4-dehydrorhamnose 3,5-epimerase
VKRVATAIPDVLLLEPAVHGDSRGYFFESWNARTFHALGLDVDFVQDNQSRSARGVLRGLHYQVVRPQGKLTRVVSGRAFAVAVDLRASSATFGKWVGNELSATNKRLCWIPPGFAHGFLSLADDTDYLYKCTDFRAPEHERVLRWDDPALGISWPLDGLTVQLAPRDAGAATLDSCETYP